MSIPLQYSCLENPMDRGAWKAAVHGVAEGWTRLSDFTFTFHFHALEKEMITHSSVLAWKIPGTGEPGGKSFSASPSQGRWDPDSLRQELSLGGKATAWECSPGRSLCLTKSSACGRLWQFAFGIEMKTDLFQSYGHC